jgi:predicted Zn-dependent protease
MGSVRMALLASSLCAGSALGQVPAQVPDSGRWQDLAFAAGEVDSRMEDSYIARVVGLAAAGRLDEDRALLARVRAIGAALIRAAVDMKPEAAEWQWEFHVTSDPEVEAFCMAGGKILVGAGFVHQLALDDGELATLLAHEVAHAVAEHHREILSAALFLNQPAVPLDVLLERMDTDLGMQIRLAGLASLQESEADQLGMVLAHRAGWPAAAMLSFYRKLAGIDSGSGLASSHPAPGSRVSMAKGMALLFGR